MSGKLTIQIALLILAIAMERAALRLAPSRPTEAVRSIVSALGFLATFVAVGIWA